MLVGAEAMSAFRIHYPDATAKEEGGHGYVHLPALTLPNGSVSEALIQFSGSGSYPTRLLLPAVVSGKGQNWTEHCIFGRTWHTWSWKDVPADLPIIEVLLNHLGALQ